MTGGRIPDASEATAVRQAVRSPKTAELIASQLRRVIVRGELRPGDRLPSEAQLMERFGVSRPTLREAFRILESESLISVLRGSRGGARVTAPQAAVASRYVSLLLQVRNTTIADVYEARMVLEPACARLLAQRRTDADLRDLRDHIEHLHQVVENRGRTADPLEWSRLTYRFHELVLQRSGNRTLALHGELLHDIVSTHMAITVSRDIHDPATIGLFRRTVRSYRKLVDLVEARDSEGAERHWRTHMEAAAEWLMGTGLRGKTVVDLFD
ncbi:DNA-binding transcriptional regulator, FadR family [Thermomonospora echinospora]|uniref:DNA-binding transcriptional regulator, FadR family n=1 Tax=Thermomonospora echinospora TaxID=1992 RepID=A0A1H6DTE9_9ACTN|nr:FadR/GntR family transcriptional regulator [Thermomonospora echinospora]SEG88520.1 DNA-binding transcriptional regulator, FadR family [Thermomonospora echinospora]